MKCTSHECLRSTRARGPKRFLSLLCAPVIVVHMQADEVLINMTGDTWCTMTGVKPDDWKKLDDDEKFIHYSALFALEGGISTDVKLFNSTITMQPTNLAAVA